MAKLATHCCLSVGQGSTAVTAASDGNLASYTSCCVKGSRMHLRGGLLGQVRLHPEQLPVKALLLRKETSSMPACLRPGSGRPPTCRPSR